MYSPKVNFKKIVTLTLIILLIAVFSTVSLSPVVYADGGIGDLPPQYTDTTMVNSMCDGPAVIEDTAEEAISLSLWDTIVMAINALI